MLPPPIEFTQYTSVRFTEHLEIEGIRPSIGSVGDAYDNSLMEQYQLALCATLGNLTPVEYERAYHAAHVSEPQPV